MLKLFGSQFSIVAYPIFFFKEISFEARKKSLEEIKKSISQLSPSKRQDVAKQREAVQYVEDLITRCQTHVSQLSTVDKTGNYNLIPPWKGSIWICLKCQRFLVTLTFSLRWPLKVTILVTTFKCWNKMTQSLTISFTFRNYN